LLGRTVEWSEAVYGFLQVGAEVGRPGFIFFLGMFGSAFAALKRLQRNRAVQTPGVRSLPAPQLAQALMAALIAYMVGGFFLALAYHELLYTLVALVAALQKVAGPPPLRRVPRPLVQRA